jgi:hypothetical protein
MTAIRTITRLQDADDAPTLGAGQDGQVLAWDNGTGAFVAAAAGGGDFSAVVDAAGDGDYTTLAAALAAASAGDALFVKNGTYAGGVTISLDGVTLRGESRDGAVIQSPLSSTPAITVTGDDVIIDSVTVDGRRSSQTGTGTAQGFSGIYVLGQRVVVRNCAVKNTLGNGITANGSPTDINDGEVTNCVITNTATDGVTPTTGAHLVGVQLINGTYRWRITGNYVSGWSQGIGLWYGATHCVVAHNNVYANYGYADAAHTLPRSAIEDYGATTTTHGHNLWAGNIINGATSECIECAQGVIGSRFVNNICLNPNKFGDNTGFGITVAGVTAEPTRDITLSGNTLLGDATGTLRTGMRIGTQGTVKVINNDIIDCANTASSGALALNNATTRAIIQGNTLRNCAGGVYTVVDPALLIVTGNEILSPASTLILINIIGGTAFTISNNTLDANGVNCTGIQIAATAGNGHIITGNTCKSFIASCIDVRRGNCQITHNYCQTTSGFGAIRLDGANAKYNNVRWNYCDANNAVRTIYFANSAASNVVQENWLIGAAAGVVDFPTSPWVAQNSNIITPNNRHTQIVPITGLFLGAQTVGATEATIAHGLPWTPREIQVVMTSAGTVWKSKASDATNIYLTADDAGRTCEVTVL